MKLSEAQQRVLDRMGEGWDLISYTHSNTYYLGKIELGFPIKVKVRNSTFKILRRRGDIKFARSQRVMIGYLITWERGEGHPPVPVTES